MRSFTFKPGRELRPPTSDIHQADVGLEVVRQFVNFIQNTTFRAGVTYRISIVEEG